MWLIDDDAFLQVDPKHPDRSGLKTRLKSAQKRLQKASKDGTLTLMVGNGISLNAVYEARHLLAGTRNSAKAKSWNEVVEGQFKNLFGAAPPTLNPLIMAQAIARRKGRNGLLRAIERGTKKTIQCHLHRLIAELKPRYIVTTNYDSLLEEALPMCSCYVRARRVSHGRATPEIIKMHGSFAPGRRTDVARLYPGFSRSDANKSIVISETDYDKCTGELIRKGRNNTPLWRALTRTLLIIGKGVLWEDLSFMWALRQRAQMKIAGKKCGPAWWLVDSSISGDRLLTLQNLDIVPIQMGFPVQKDPNGAHHYFANVEAFRRLFGTRLKKALEHNATIDKKKWDTTRRRLVKAPNVVAIGLTALNTV